MVVCIYKEKKEIYEGLVRCICGLDNGHCKNDFGCKKRKR